MVDQWPERSSQLCRLLVNHDTHRREMPSRTNPMLSCNDNSTPEHSTQTVYMITEINHCLSSLRGDVAVCAEASNGPSVQPHIP